MPDLLPWQSLNDLIQESIDEYRKMRSGIHISMLATTRGGKTTLATGGQKDPGHGILGHFEDALIIDSTADPGILSQYGKPLNKFGSIHGHRRITVSNMSNDSKMAIWKAMERARKQGNIAIYVDEVRQLASKEFFGLGDALNHIWFFGAKKGVSLIGGTQQPVFVPAPFYDQAKLHFLFHMRDIRRVKRLGEIGGDTEQLFQVIPTLKRHEFAFVDLDGNVTVSKYEIPSRKKEPETPKERRIVVRRTVDNYVGSG